jgi:hypothetical protein
MTRLRDFLQIRATHRSRNEYYINQAFLSRYNDLDLFPWLSWLLLAPPSLRHSAFISPTMRFSALVVAAASCAITCSAAPSSSNRHVLHEKRDYKPHLWEKRDRATPSQVLPIRIGLRQRNIENAESYIYEVADPTSPNFGMSILNG